MYDVKIGYLSSTLLRTCKALAVITLIPPFTRMLLIVIDYDLSEAFRMISSIINNS